MLPRLVILASKKGRETYIERVVQEMAVTPYNIFRIGPEDGSIAIDRMRQLFPLFLTKSPTDRLIIIDSFDLATVEAQNSLLKLLEEKTGKTLFLLFADQAEGVIATIRSRTRIVYPEGKNAVQDTSVEISRFADTLAEGSLMMLNSADHLLKTKEEVLVRINDFIFHYQRELIKNPSVRTVAILKKLLATRREIQTANVNPQFAYDILLIFISRLATIK